MTTDSRSPVEAKGSVLDPHQDLLKNIFSKALSGSKLFQNREVLSFDYVPERILFREQQISSIASILSPVLRGSKPSNILLYGSTGTGKTATVKYTLNALSFAGADVKKPISLCYCNARTSGTEYRVLYEFGSTLGMKLPFTGLAVAEVSSRIIQRINENKFSAVLILDEIDFLVKNYGDNLLYEFTRAGERIPDGFLSLVGISNDLTFKEYLDPRVVSSLSEEEIVFPPYTASELEAILNERSSLAFTYGSVTSGAISLCAALAGSEHGDARRAVDLLRVAGEIAEREGDSEVREHHVRVAMQRIEKDRITDAVTSLPTHAKIVLLSALSAQGKSTGEIHAQYKILCSRCGIEALTQRRVSSLLNELDLLGLISAKTISQGRYGRTKKVSIPTQISSVRDVLSKDPLLGGLVDFIL